MTRALAAAGRFLWEFLIGESPVAFVATLAVIATAFGLAGHGWVAAAALTLLVVAALVVGAYLGRQRSRSGAGNP